MAIPEPVANTACAEETTLRCGRKEKKGGGALLIQHKAKLLNPTCPRLPAPGGKW